MKFYLYKVIGLDEKDPDIVWITVKGNHIPIKKGSSKEETGKQIAEFFANKGEGIKTQKQGKQSVFTGSGTHFDKPSTKHIGSGVGSQLLGWGLYFTNKRGIAKYYRESSTPLELNGKDIKVPMDMKERILDAMEWKKTKPDYFDSYVKNVEGRLQRAKDDIEQYKKDEQTLPDNKKANATIMRKQTENDLKNIQLEYDLVKGIENNTLKHDLRKGQILRAKIPANKYLLIDNEDLYDQPELVKKGLLAISEKYGLSFQDVNGARIYTIITNQICKNNSKKASLMLYEYGIKGIKSVESENTSNFVIFNDNDIKVEKINRTGDSLDN